MKISKKNGIQLGSICMFILLAICSGRIIAETHNDPQPFTFNIDVSKNGCQMAIWLVDNNGRFVETIYVTRKTAVKGLGNRGGKLDDRLGGSRLSTLPVWAYHRGKDDGSGNFYPSKDKPLPDAITSATPKAGEFIWTWRPQKQLTPGKYYFYIEANKSFDDNAHHDYSWYRGQPSVVWRGDIVVGKEKSKSAAKIIGHGHVAGANGKIYPDLSTLTTALELITKAEAVFVPGK